MISETKKAIIAVVFAILFVTVIAEASLRIVPTQEELIIPIAEPKPEPIPYNVTLSLRNFEVVQGELFSINLYMMSLVHETDAMTNFSWYLLTYQNQSWLSTEPVPLEITFNPNQPILKYKEPKTIVITIKSAEDAPLGEYKVILELSASVVGSNFHSSRNLLITMIPSEPETEPESGHGPEPEPSLGDNSTESIEPERDPPFPPFNVDFSNQNLRVSQGKSVSTNITWSSDIYQEEFTVSFSLELGAYQNQPVASDYQSPFEAIFEPEPLVLRYQEPKNVILTITADDDASLGLYTLTIYAMDGDKGIGAILWITVVK